MTELYLDNLRGLLTKQAPDEIEDRSSPNLLNCDFGFQGALGKRKGNVKLLASAQTNPFTWLLKVNDTYCLAGDGAIIWKVNL